ncbi:MAG: hypothetical protein IJC26_03200 [Clostridia bacterium]|nr:hypothetical protein [Clostridia bacterium]
MIEKYDRKRFREKFRKYRIWFSVLAVAFLAALVGEIFFLGDMGYAYERKPVLFFQFFSDLFTAELLLLLLVFLMGVTLYAPVFGFLSVAARGCFAGFCMVLLAGDLKSGKGVWLLVLSLFYLLSSSWLFLGYASFCTATALQIYSPPQTGAKGGERRMFGGTLFYSSFLKGTVNFRFLLSYCLFFVAAVFFCFLLSFVYASLRSLL